MTSLHDLTTRRSPARRPGRFTEHRASERVIWPAPRTSDDSDPLLDEIDRAAMRPFLHLLLLTVIFLAIASALRDQTVAGLWIATVAYLFVATGRLARIAVPLPRR